MTRVMLILVTVLLALPTLAAAQSIEGTWRLEEFESANLPSPTETPSLMILADGHYSRVFVRGRSDASRAVVLMESIYRQQQHLHVGGVDAHVGHRSCEGRWGDGYVHHRRSGV